MSQKAYIRSACAISPQHSFEAEQFLQPVVSTDDKKLFVIDQEYRKYISPVAIRRMSRLLKMSISTGMQCLQNAGIGKPDGIITGTGRGSVSDMEHFLKDMIAYKEEALNPTYFIQSTYNSVNGWLALQTKCTEYNQTYVNRGFSFELALLDAIMLLNETPEPKYYLTGCYDEITDEYCGVKDKINYWKKEPINNLNLIEQHNTTGTIAGEGAAFFTLSNEGDNAICIIDSIKMLQEPTADIVLSAVNDVLAENNLTLADIDVLLCGLNGDKENHLYYNKILSEFKDNTTICTFKHLCGEYDTATGFAMWLATQIFLQQQVPDVVTLKRGTEEEVKHLLIINNYIQHNTSVLLLSVAE